MKRYSTYLMMLALAFVSFSLTSCEVDWYEDNYCGGGYYDDELNALDLAEVLSGTWSGSMQYKDGESGQMYSWDVSMTFVQNNRYAIKGTGVLMIEQVIYILLMLEVVRLLLWMLMLVSMDIS